jgi:small subunit ribosomal protein S1
MEGVEGLVHISELAQHHVENPREIVDPGDTVKVKILEIDDERRRLSLSLKRVEGQVLPSREIPPGDETEGDDGADMGEVPDLDLSEEVFAGDDTAPPTPEAEAEAPQPEVEAEAPEPEALAEPEVAEPEALAEPEVAEQAEQAEPEAVQPPPEQAEPS